MLVSAVSMVSSCRYLSPLGPPYVYGGSGESNRYSTAQLTQLGQRLPQAKPPHERPQVAGTANYTADGAGAGAGTDGDGTDGAGGGAEGAGGVGDGGADGVAKGADVIPNPRSRYSTRIVSKRDQP